MIEIRHFDEVCLDKRVSARAARVSAELMERYGARFSMDRWDHRVIAAFDGGDVVGFIQFKRDDQRPTLDVSLAWCSVNFPGALLRMAGSLRAWARSERVAEITFIFHKGNDEMARLAGIIGASVVSHYCVLEMAPLPAAKPS